MIYGIAIIIALAIILFLIYRRLPEVRRLEEKFAAVSLPEHYTEEEAENYFQRGDWSKAEKVYLHLAASQPRQPKFYNRLGIIYLKQKNFSDARASFETAVKIDPTVASRFYNLAAAWQHLNNKKKARQAIVTALRFSPRNKKYQEALEEIEK